MDRRRALSRGETEEAVEAALSYCPGRFTRAIYPGGTAPFACALEGRKMQPDCVVSVVPDPAQDDSIRQVLGSLIGERQYELWFRQKTRLVAEHGALVVYAASPFHQKWLQKQHRGPLVQAARMVLGPSARVRFEVDASLSPAAAPAGAALILKTATPAFAPDRALRVTAPADAPMAVGRPGRRFANLGDFFVGACNELALTAVRQV